MAILVRRLKKPGTLVSSSDSRQLRSGYVLEPGKEIGEHETGGGEELIIFVDGTGEVSPGGVAETVRSPSVALVPAHTIHNVKNKSKVPLRYVYACVIATDSTR